MSFSEQQIKLLEAPLLRENVANRKQAGRQLSYIEGWHAIAEANRIFGFDSWTRETFDVRCINEKAREIGADKRLGWGVSYIAKVRVSVGGGGGGGVFSTTAAGVVREGIGAGHGIDVDLGLAHESAIKEAETDAMKRALMTFGNPFGLALYDKTQANVSDEPSGPTMSEMLEAQQKVLHGSALKGANALKEAWLKTAADLKPALKHHLDEVLKPIAKAHDDIKGTHSA